MRERQRDKERETDRQTEREREGTVCIVGVVRRVQREMRKYL